MPEKEQVYEDWSLVAFFSLPDIQKKHHLKVTPFKQNSNRIAWKVSGDIEGALNEIFQDKKISISAYMQSLRSVRHCIYTLRGV